MKQLEKSGIAKVVLAAAIVASAIASEAEMTISVDSVVQRWPWNNKVDITYTIDEGQDVSSSDFSKVVFTAVIGGVAHTIDGTTVGASSSTGTHKVTWTLPSGLKSADCTMTVAVYPADVPSGNDYMIIDLDTGAISYEGLYATQEESNSRYNTALYKTDKMVLRKVPAGTYRTGDSTHYPSTLTGTDSYKINTQKNWTTDRDYYMGVFPVTHVQYAKVFDMDPSSKTAAASGNIADHRPVEGVSWFRLRCDAVANAYYVAATSSIPAAVGANKGTFFQRLNYRTGKYFDLPTEVMWEIAARAGTDTYFYWGNTTNDIGTASNNILDYVICKLNSGSLTFAVGSRLPNNWGLYDMVGNVTQLCLDDTVSGSMSLRKDAFTPATVSNPGSQTDASEKRLRSCLSYDSSINPNAQGFHPAHVSNRNKTTIKTGTSSLGFRVSHIVD